MTYAIATIIYGIPLNDDVHNIIFNWLQQTGEDEGIDEFVDEHFTTLYTAYGGPAGYCGVEIFEFSEGDDIDISLLKDKLVTPSSEIISKAEKEILKISKELLKLLPKPDLYLVWNSS